MYTSAVVCCQNFLYVLFKTDGETTQADRAYVPTKPTEPDDDGITETKPAVDLMAELEKGNIRRR